MLSWSWRSIKLLLLHLVGFYITLPTLMMYSQTQIKIKYIISELIIWFGIDHECSQANAQRLLLFCAICPGFMFVILPLQTEKGRTSWESKTVRIKVSSWRQYNDSAGVWEIWGRPREESGDSGHLGTDAVILAEWLLKFRKKKSSTFIFKGKAVEQLDCWPLKIKTKQIWGASSPLCVE